MHVQCIKLNTCLGSKHTPNHSSKLLNPAGTPKSKLPKSSTQNHPKFRKSTKAWNWDFHVGIWSLQGVQIHAITKSEGLLTIRGSDQKEIHGYKDCQAWKSMKMVSLGGEDDGECNGHVEQQFDLEALMRDNGRKGGGEAAVAEMGSLRSCSGVE